MAAASSRNLQRSDPRPLPFQNKETQPPVLHEFNRICNILIRGRCCRAGNEEGGRHPAFCKLFYLQLLDGSRGDPGLPEDRPTALPGNGSRRKPSSTCYRLPTRR